MKNAFTLMGAWMFYLVTVAQPSGINEKQLEDLVSFTKETFADGVLICHGDNIISEWYNPGCDSLYMNTASAVKSWTNVVIGRLVFEGLIDSIDDPVCKYVPEWKAGCNNGITIRHLMTMTAGIDKRRVVKGPKRAIFLEEDFNEFVTAIEPDTVPGIRWSYSNESVQLLAPVIEGASGSTAQECFQTYLFEPLGMDSSALFMDPARNAVTFGGAKTTLRDFLKVAQLMMNDGKLNGKRLLPEGWVEDSTTPTAQNAYYGLLWWCDPGLGNFSAMGDFGQLCVVYPREKLVYLRYQTCRNQDQSQNLNWMGPQFFEMIRNTVQ